MNNAKELKLCVYAICKNESKFVDRWVRALQEEADCVVVLDTGSTDNTVELLKQYEPFVTVKQYDYSKDGIFRFDKARNDSLKLVPFDTDICVVLDLDQVPLKGWSKIIKERFSEGYTEVYGYIVDHDENGNELNRWRSKNVHPNSPYYIWDKVIHEGINDYSGNKVKGIFDENFIINHYPDLHKDRGIYKDLLYYACKEHPEDSYYAIYLGIELAKYSKEESANAFRRALKECDFTNNSDIYYQTYINLALSTDDTREALDCLYSAEAIGEENNIKTRRLYVTFANIFEEKGEDDKAIDSLEKALAIQSNSNDWREDSKNFSGYIEDRLSLFYYYKKHNLLKAIEYSTKALSLDPNNERMLNNLKFYYNSYINKR